MQITNSQYIVRHVAAYWKLLVIYSLHRSSTCTVRSDLVISIDRHGITLSSLRAAVTVIVTA